MAKSKGEGASQGLIITLIFFVILSLVLGALAYFGTSEQEKLVDAAKKAKAEKDAASVKAEEEEIRKLALRVAIGIEEPNDRKEIEALIGSRKDKFLDEVNLLRGKLQNVGFAWDSVQGGDVPAPAPKETIVQIVSNLAKIANTAVKNEDAAKADAKAARDNAAKAQQLQQQAEATFKDGLAKLEAKFGELSAKSQEEFKKYQAGLDTKGKEFQDSMNKLADERDNFARELDPVKKRLEESQKLNGKLLSERTMEGADLIKNDYKKGLVVRRDGQFVILDIGSAVGLRPNTTFAILPSGAAWRDNAEKEKLIKAKIEVVEIQGPYSARAKILSENEAIRNPIGIKDEIYNPAWSPNQAIHIAFAGIIDINGDGYDDNEQFIRILESAGVKLDQYLDLKTRELKGSGLNYNTKFLVIGPDARLLDATDTVDAKDPRVAIINEVNSKMGQMKAKAKELGIQVIEARKFLNYIGIKAPDRSSPADYGYLSK